MTEVLGTDKEIIERLTRELYDQKEENGRLKLQVEELKAIIENNDKRNGFIDLKESDEYRKIEKEKNEYKELNDEWNRTFNVLGFKGFDDLNEFISNKKDNKINQSELDIKIKSAVNLALEEEKLKHNEEINVYKNNIQKLENNLNNFNSNLPTPSASSENKIEKDINNNILKIHDDLDIIVYYRKTKNDKTKANIVKDMTRNGILHLTCCGESYKNLLLYHDKYTTCPKCYLSYKLDNNGKLLNNILKQHIIDNEKEILNKIKCNLCSSINKKQIDICFNCKKEQNAVINVFNIPSKKDIGYNTKTLISEETYYKLKYLFEIVKSAEKDGVDTSNWKILIDYIKENKLVEEKQSNIIRNKFIRTKSIYLLYNDSKYDKIENYIKRLNFSIKGISKLNDIQWNKFRVELEKKLNSELEKNNKLNELNFSCKNDICEEEVSIENNYCKSCEADLKKCKNCNEEFWTDDLDINHCDDCDSDYE